MQFVKIQHKDTLEIIQWRVDGMRVTFDQYDQKLNGYRNGYSCSLTTRTKSGNFRHSFETN